MKALFRLTGNEIKKIWKQTGYRIVLFIILGIILLVPVFNALIGINEPATAEEQRDMYLDMAQNSSYDDDMMKEYNKAMADSYSYFIDNGLADSWKYNVYISEYIYAYQLAYAFRLCAEGKYSPEYIFGWFNYYDRGNSEGWYDGNDVYYEKPADGEGKDFDPYDEDNDYNALLTDANAALEALKKEISDATEKTYFENTVKSANEAVKNAQNTYNAYYMNYQADKSNENLKYMLDVSEKRLESCIYRAKAAQLLYDTDAEPYGWADNLSRTSLPSALNGYESLIPIPEKTYDSDDNNGMSYEKYVKTVERQKDSYLKAINTYIYAIENNVQPRGVSGNSGGSIGGFIGIGGTVKAINYSAIETMVTLLTVLLMVAAAGMISSEYSSGTIRMLLIRPRSRAQIIGSKLLALLIIFLVLSIGMMLIMTLEVMLFNGVGDLFVNDIICVGDAIGQIPAFLGMLGHYALCALPALLLIAFTTMLAAATKKNGLTNTLSMLVLFFGSLAVELCIILMTVFPVTFGWLAYSPFAYVSLSNLVSPGFEVISGTYMYSTYGMNLWIGVAYNLLFFGVFIWLTFLAFRKSQVKS